MKIQKQDWLLLCAFTFKLNQKWLWIDDAFADDYTDDDHNHDHDQDEDEDENEDDEDDVEDEGWKKIILFFSWFLKPSVML